MSFRNALTGLPDGFFRSLTRLQHVQLAHNKISTLPEGKRIAASALTLVPSSSLPSYPPITGPDLECY
jgi:hypothetical protein